MSHNTLKLAAASVFTHFIVENWKAYFICWSLLKNSEKLTVMLSSVENSKTHSDAGFC